MERTNLTAVARAVGMSAKALENFLTGDPIRSASRRKLFAWLMDTDLEADARGAECVRIIQTLVADLPAERQPRAVVRLLEVIRQEFDPQAGAPVPLWLSRVSEKVAGYVDDLEQTRVANGADQDEAAEAASDARDAGE